MRISVYISIDKAGLIIDGLVSLFKTYKGLLTTCCWLLASSMHPCLVLPVLPQDIQHIIFRLADFCIDTRLALQISPTNVKPAARCVHKVFRRRLYHHRLNKQKRRHSNPVVLYSAKKVNFTLEVFLLNSSCVACTLESFFVYAATFFQHNDSLHCHGDGVWQELMEFQKKAPSRKRIDDFELEIEDYLRGLPIDNTKPCPNDCQWAQCEVCDPGAFMDTEHKTAIVQKLIGDIVSQRLCLALAQNMTVHAPRAQCWRTSDEYVGEWFVHGYLQNISRL